MVRGAKMESFKSRSQAIGSITPRNLKLNHKDECEDHKANFKRFCDKYKDEYNKLVE